MREDLKLRLERFKGQFPVDASVEDRVARPPVEFIGEEILELAVSALLQGAGIPMYAAALGKDTADVRALDLSNAAVVIGSEGRGVSQAVLEVCSGTLSIPMSRRCESLNAAVAAAVILWEMARETLAGTGPEQ